MSYTITKTVDARGLNCPLPILRIKKAIAAANKGDVIKMLTTAHGSVKDIESFCKQTGHELIESGELNDAYEFIIRKS